MGVLAYCVMPDHVHVLLEGMTETADLRDAVARWKQRTGYIWRRCYGAQLWQPGYHDRVLREGDDTRARLNVTGGAQAPPYDYNRSLSLA